jgi:NAD(P)-dependent dehydrogenase (short-subunit alcohol dehydrogenase family)
MTETMPTPAELFDLTGKVALVTGGSRGLGRAIALGLASAGADVMVVSRKQGACDATAGEITARTGRRAVGCAGHVGRWSEIDAVAEAAYAEFGTVDILVNNAGISPLYDSPSSITEELYDKVLNVNLKGPFRLTALIGTRMAGGAGGSIINVSSTAAIRPRAHILPYAAAKAGLEALTVGFAHAFGPTVRVNTLMPGPFLTDVAASWDSTDAAQRYDSYALRRPAQPWEVVGTALYLASGASSYTTGATVAVHGGRP